MTTGGVTGIQVHSRTGWIHAFYRGQQIGGITFAEARTVGEGVVEWFYRAISHFWGAIVAAEVTEAAVVTVNDDQSSSSMLNVDGLTTVLDTNDTSSSPTLSSSVSTILRA